MFWWIVLAIVAFRVGWRYGCCRLLPAEIGRRESFYHEAALQKYVQHWWHRTIEIFLSGLGVFAASWLWVLICDRLGQSIESSKWVYCVCGGGIAWVSALLSARLASRPSLWKTWRPVVSVPQDLIKARDDLDQEIKQLRAEGGEGKRFVPDLKAKREEVVLRINGVWGAAVLERWSPHRHRLAAQVDSLQENPDGYPKLEEELECWLYRLHEVKSCAHPVQSAVSNNMRWIGRSTETVRQARKRALQQRVARVIGAADTVIRAQDELDQTLVQRA